MLHVEQKKPWTLSLRAKAKNLDFKLRASRFFPACKFLSFSIRFEIRSYLFELKSKPESSFSWKPKSLKLKFFRLFKSFNVRSAKNKGMVRSWYAHKNGCYWRRKTCICLWVLLFAILGSLMVVQLGKYFGGVFVWKYFWKNAWNYAAPSGILYNLSKAYYYGFD